MPSLFCTLGQDPETTTTTCSGLADAALGYATEVPLQRSAKSGQPWVPPATSPPCRWLSLACPFWRAKPYRRLEGPRISYVPRAEGICSVGTPTNLTLLEGKEPGPTPAETTHLPSRKRPGSLFHHKGKFRGSFCISIPLSVGLPIPPSIAQGRAGIRCAPSPGRQGQGTAASSPTCCPSPRVAPSGLHPPWPGRTRA